jgi:hypothetical protein
LSSGVKGASAPVSVIGKVSENKKWWERHALTIAVLLPCGPQADRGRSCRAARLQRSRALYILARPGGLPHSSASQSPHPKNVLFSGSFRGLCDLIRLASSLCRYDEAAVHSNHAATTSASSPSTIEIEISLACVIGEATAMAAIAIAVALDERRQGRISSTIKQQGGDLIAALYNLRQKCAGDFDAIAREYGKRALVARYIQAKGKLNVSCPPFTEEMADEMTSWPLDALHKVIAAEMN